MKAPDAAERAPQYFEYCARAARPPPREHAARGADRSPASAASGEGALRAVRKFRAEEHLLVIVEAHTRPCGGRHPVGLNLWECRHAADRRHAFGAAACTRRWASLT